MEITLENAEIYDAVADYVKAKFGLEDYKVENVKIRSAKTIITLGELDDTGTSRSGTVDPANPPTASTTA